jgi:hypothetical protein
MSCTKQTHCVGQCGMMPLLRHWYLLLTYIPLGPSCVLVESIVYASFCFGNNQKRKAEKGTGVVIISTSLWFWLQDHVRTSTYRNAIMHHRDLISGKVKSHLTIHMFLDWMILFAIYFFTYLHSCNMSMKIFRLFWMWAVALVFFPYSVFLLVPLG